MNLVLDASVAVKFYVPEIYEEEASRLLEGGHSLHVPELIFPEFANIIWKKVRGGEMSNEEGREIVDAFVLLDVVVHSHRDLIRSSFEGAAETGQTVYDWTYLALATSLSCELVTADRKFYDGLASTSFIEHLLWIGDI